MATQISLNDGAIASAGALAIQTNGTTQAVSISTGQVATLAQNPILTSGTANGVAYLNGSKVLTSGTALKWNGTNLAIGAGATTQGNVEIQATGTDAGLWVQTGGTTNSYVIADFRNGSNSSAFKIFGNARSTFLTTVGVGEATPSTSGSGITFPATQSASSDANTLDDYEEGTWTPALAGEGGGSNTFTVKYGYYTKVGRLVTITFATSAIASPSAQTNSWNITGLPFQSANLTATQAVLWGGSFSHYRQFPVQASSTGLFPSCRPNTATLRISVMYGGPAQTETTYVTGGTPSATLEISGTITYETA